MFFRLLFAGWTDNRAAKSEISEKRGTTDGRAFIPAMDHLQAAAAGLC